MTNDMENLYTDVALENPASRGVRAHVNGVLVSPNAAVSCFPAAVLEGLGVAREKRLHFQKPDGTLIERWTGAAILCAAGTCTIDDVVFGEPGDVVLLGARSLTGLNRIVDPVTKSLVDAGPISAAAMA